MLLRLIRLNASSVLVTGLEADTFPGIYWKPLVLHIRWMLSKPLETICLFRAVNVAILLWLFSKLRTTPHYLWFI